MATKYELATELRALTRGMKAGPICRMKKHELEAEIDRVKALKAIPVAEHAPAKPGPLGPREIPVSRIVKEGVTITVPEVPKVRIVKNTDSIHRYGPATLDFDGPASPVPKTAPAKPHRCNCSKCPERAAKVTA